MPNCEDVDAFRAIIAWKWEASMEVTGDDARKPRWMHVTRTNIDHDAMYTNSIDGVTMAGTQS